MTLSALERLDLSHNIILRIENLSGCPHLDSINLGFNSIASVARLFEVLGNVRSLNLSNNRIQYTAGLEKLLALEHLDLSANLISSTDEVRRLGILPCLQTLSLDGNPISTVAGYRDTVFSFFVPTEDFIVRPAASLFVRMRVFCACCTSGVYIGAYAGGSSSLTAVPAPRLPCRPRLPLRSVRASHRAARSKPPQCRPRPRQSDAAP